MKKLILNTLLIGTACGLWASGVCTPKTATLETRLERAVLTQGTQRPSWREKIKQMQTQFQKVGAPTVQSCMPTVLNKKDWNNYHEKTYKERLFRLQAQINQHKDLKGYRFAAPLPADLAKLSYDNYEALEAFCEDTQLAEVTQFEFVYPFTISLHIRGISGGAVEVWVDEPTKTVYLMSDNLETSAAAKYGLYELMK